MNVDMPTVQIGDEELERVQSLRLLGITFDRYLSFKDHISRVVIKARKGLTDNGNQHDASKGAVYPVPVISPVCS